MPLPVLRRRARDLPLRPEEAWECSLCLRQGFRARARGEPSPCNSGKAWECKCSYVFAMGEENYYFRKANTRLLDILGCNCGQHKHNGKRVPQLCTGMCQGECSLKNCRGARVTCPDFLYPAASFDISTIQHFFAHLFRRFPFLLPQGGAPTPTITTNTAKGAVARGAGGVKEAKGLLSWIRRLCAWRGRSWPETPTVCPSTPSFA